VHLNHIYIYIYIAVKFHVSCNSNCTYTSSAKMADAINEAMNEMKELLQ